MKPVMCAGYVNGGRNVGEYRCSQLGHYEHDGKWYCKAHHKPTQEAAKREKALRDRAIEYMRRHHAEIVADWEEGLWSTN